jgi:hypothetical protein
LFISLLQCSRYNHDCFEEYEQVQTIMVLNSVKRGRVLCTGPKKEDVSVGRVHGQRGIVIVIVIVIAVSSGQ